MSNLWSNLPISIYQFPISKIGFVAVKPGCNSSIVWTFPSLVFLFSQEIHWPGQGTGKELKCIKKDKVKFGKIHCDRIKSGTKWCLLSCHSKANVISCSHQGLYRAIHTNWKDSGRLQPRDKIWLWKKDEKREITVWERSYYTML